ncbi:MAG: alpha/beta hydrolase-fold protein, partial [Acidobacteriota bacterium]
MKTLLMCLLLAAPAAGADKLTAPQLIDLARHHPARLREALVATLTADALAKGTAVLGRGEHFIWAVDATSRPTLLLDEAPGPPMRRIAGSDTWYATGTYAVRTSHAFAYTIAGKTFGGSKDVAAFGPDSYLKAGVPQGTLSDKLVHTSKAIYEGLRSNYWTYVPAQYTPSTPAALMVFQDGQGYVRPESEHDRGRIIDALDNLIYEHKIPVMIAVFVQPGDITQSPDSAFAKEMVEKFKASPAPPPGARPRGPQNMVRGTQYDTVTDRYARFLRDELLAEVQSRYNIRKDSYSRGITGQSSGGIAAFNVAWQQPEQFSR